MDSVDPVKEVLQHQGQRLDFQEEQLSFLRQELKETLQYTVNKATANAKLASQRHFLLQCFVGVTLLPTEDATASSGNTVNPPVPECVLHIQLSNPEHSGV